MGAPQTRDLSTRPSKLAVSLVLAAAVVMGACTTTPGETNPSESTTSSVAPQTITTVPLPPTTTEPAPSSTTTTTTPAAFNGTVVTPDDDLAALVADANPGTEFQLTAGTHRSPEIHPKDGMVFTGLPGAVLSGAVVVNSFSKEDDGWVSNQVRLNPDRHGSCVDDYTGCELQNDLFIDDTLVWRVDTRAEVEPGTWWGDDSTIVIGDDPASRKVEVSVVEHAFIGDADDVTIKDLVVEMYATRAQRGAIQAQLPENGRQGSGWLIEGVETRFNHAAGIKAGNETIIRDVHAHHNGQLGISASRGTNVVIEDSEIDHNNTRGFRSGWEAGGTKFTYTTGLTVRRNLVHNNLGPGLWTDIDNYDTTYADNVVYANTGPGIFHEISFDAVISGNEVYENGFGQTAWLWGAGILVAASQDVEVANNTVYANGDGIAGIQQDRQGSDDEVWILDNLWVHDNVVTMTAGQTGVVQDVDDPTIFIERNLRFEDNTYFDSNHDAFAWGNRDISWVEWNASGFDTKGTLVDE